ncbi:MAG: hypothetical protein M3177_11715 [Pseudomonadota bacterium]|nr:hypothetical protein [Pseudomonadota bacterium]
MCAAGALLLALAAAQRPAVLAQTSGGSWEISRVQSSSAPVRMCLRDPAILAQFEHRGTSCTRVVIRDQPSVAEIHYTCAGGGFGRTTLTLITPRSLRVETQGISGKVPFNYVLHARRVGDCGGH